MCLSLLQKKLLKTQNQYQDIHAKGQVTVHKWTKLLGLLASTVQVVFPAHMNFRFLQQHQKKALRGSQRYQERQYSSTAIQRKNVSGESKISRNSMGVT